MDNGDLPSADEPTPHRPGSERPDRPRRRVPPSGWIFWSTAAAGTAALLAAPSACRTTPPADAPTAAVTVVPSPAPSISAAVADQPHDSALAECHGETKRLTVSSQMPYCLARVGAAKGYFVLDFGTSFSTIDPMGFSGGMVPQPLPNTPDSFADFNFYSSWGTVRLDVQNHANISGVVRQAGIIGTDFLSLHAYTFDYANHKLYRAESRTFCDDTVLHSEGFSPVSTEGFYSSDLTKVKAGLPNIPTVPVRIGAVTAVAQLDTAFDDGLYHHSVNINRALFDAVKAAGVALTPIPHSTIALSTCVNGQDEKVSGYRLPSGAPFEIVGVDGRAVISAGDAAIFLKETPAAARVCGGIGTWDTPAAQVGASFYVDAKQVVFDPFKSRVWFPTSTPHENPSPGSD